MNWVVNLRQTFETVCTEVDKLSQEARYVESQVQTVGVNVNKFFTEVIHDYLPSSCVSPAHRQRSTSIVVKNDNDTDEDSSKMKVFHKELEEIAPAKNDSCLSEDPNFHNENDFLSPASEDPGRGAGPVKPLEENNDLNISKPTTEGDNSVMNEKHDPSLPEVVAPIAQQLSLLSSPRKTFHLNPEASWNPTNTVDSFVSKKKNSGTLINVQSTVHQEVNTGNVKPLAEKCAPLLSEIVSPVVLFHDILKNKQTTENQAGLPEVSAVLSALNDMSASSFFTEVSLDHEKACAFPLNCPTASTEVTGHESSPQSGLVSNLVVNPREHYADDSSSFSSNNLDSPAVDCNNLESRPSPSSSILSADSKVTGTPDVAAAKSCVESIEVFDEVKLADSCIVVDNKNVLVPPRTNVRRSFKKKLQDALASRMRSTTRREYEQLAIMYGDIDADISLRRESSPSCFSVHDMKLKQSADDLDDWEIVQ